MSAPVKTLLPGATLGVMGGGQLGRMFVHAAQSMGYATAVLDADPTSPAGLVSHHHLAAAYTDTAALAELARVADAVTTEFENVPAPALRVLAQSRPVAPGADAVAICQDRAAEKAHFQRAGVPCAPYAVVDSDAALASVDAALLPGILKTATLGYDGKGQVRVATRDELTQAWQKLGKARCVLEQMLPLQNELSVIVARGGDGDAVTFPVQQNLHRDGILAVTQVPAPQVSAELAEDAARCAKAIAASMGYVGVLCVEFFVVAGADDSPRLVANEMAPRPHNSGHYTIDACDVSQFDLQVRCMAGLPLIAPRLHSPAVMLNLLGDLWFAADAHVAHTPRWAEVLALPGAHLHLYGKADARPGRKMGHLTITGATASEALERALQACAILGLPAF
ncbi:5-(carboxyamino)imidazole ribonucleotide synthase [Ideonella sp. DXS29W]|uniref:N5-carboxyaminoimidazole ribonucleotide synthase n=1 Tax=Ideonella lacteola TaxID=2984193 RepID=A0ABU9BUY3_9BURK